MRPLSLLLSIPLLLSAGAAGAQTAYPLTDNSAMSTVQVTPPPGAARLSAADLEEVGGTYQLSNGWRLTIEPGSRGINARIDRQRPIHLIALSREKFVSRDGNVSMEFDTASEEGNMRMSYVPGDARMAQIIVVKATLAQR